VAQATTNVSDVRDSNGFYSGAPGTKNASPFQLQFNDEGTFHYICEPHVASDMRGYITVSSGGGVTQSAALCSESGGGVGCAACNERCIDDGGRCHAQQYCVRDACRAGTPGCSCRSDASVAPCIDATYDCAAVGGATTRCVPAPLLLLADGAAAVDSCTAGVGGCLCITDGGDVACNGGDAFECDELLAVAGSADRGAGLCVPKRAPCVLGTAGCACTSTHSCASAALQCIDIGASDGDEGGGEVCMYEQAVSVSSEPSSGGGNGGDFGNGPSGTGGPAPLEGSSGATVAATSRTVLVLALVTAVATW